MSIIVKEKNYDDFNVVLSLRHVRFNSFMRPEK